MILSRNFEGKFFFIVYQYQKENKIGLVCYKKTQTKIGK